MSSSPSQASGKAPAIESQSSAVASRALPLPAKVYLWLVVAAGGVVCALSVYRMLGASVTQLDWQFLLLAVVTIFVGRYLIIEIPLGNGEISIADTFIFLTMLLYGGEAAILLAAAEAFHTKSRYSKKLIIVLFAGGSLACSTFLTVWAVSLGFGRITDLPQNGYSAMFVAALCVMAITQYVANSGFVAVAVGLKNKQPIWHTWSRYYLWTSITYIAGALAAGITAIVVRDVGFYAAIFVAPIIFIVYFTYRMYLKNVEAAAAQAEQARLHVEELSRYIDEQERIREQYSQIEKLSALGELASGVAHDFNNKLVGILGSAQLMLRETQEPKSRRRLQLIIQSAEDGAKTVRRIQDFARQRRDHDLAPVAVAGLLQDVCEITRPRWKDLAEASNIHIDFEIQNGSRAMVKGDAAELRDVLVNMIFNAVEAMPEGGKLVLSAEEKDRAVIISICDTGVGMDAEIRSRIFDPFYTTKGTAGMGMGLAVSYGIIRRHEGTVEVESEVGRGTIFRITLPVAEDVAANRTEVLNGTC